MWLTAALASGLLRDVSAADYFENVRKAASVYFGNPKSYAAARVLGKAIAGEDDTESESATEGAENVNPGDSKTTELAPPERGLIADRSYTIKIPLGGIPDIRDGDTVIYKSTHGDPDDEMIYEVIRPSDNNPEIRYYIPGSMATLVPVKGGSRRKTLRRRK